MIIVGINYSEGNIVLRPFCLDSEGNYGGIIFLRRKKELPRLLPRLL